MPRGMETVNISKASTTTNLFYLFFHGGKAAIIPFLTLFFRLIGLSALEAGTIIAAKTITGLIWAPIWSRCATALNRHRLVLMFSLFMMMAMYLSFPALYTQISKPEHCNPLTNNSSKVLTQNLSGLMSSSSSSSSISNQPPHVTPATTNSQTASDKTTPKPSTKRPTSTVAPTMVQPTTAVNQVELNTPEISSDSVYKDAKTIFSKLGLDPKDITGANLTAQEFFELVKIEMPDANITQSEAADLYRLMKEHDPKVVTGTKVKRDAETTREVDKRGDFSDQLKDKLLSIQATLKEDKLLLFLTILAIVVGGEIFASPVEKIADDSWFNFLNRIDDLERYGQQRFWGSIAFVLIPIIVTLAVDHTPCFLPFHIHHYLLHFYIFAVLMAGALIVSCCYPVPPPANGKYMSKVCKGLRIICCDGHGFLFSVTLLLTGMVYAAYHNFLFWRIQDLGGKETVMGLCVSVGAFSEIPMLILSNRFVKKLGQSWMVSVSLLVLSLRVLYYAFIPEPWAILPIELTHGVTHTALWFAILSYDDFNVGAAVDRSLRSILSSLYFGIGFSSGSVIAGYMYDFYDSSVLFWGCSAIIGAWCILFSIIQKCLPQKEKVRYIKLLRTESDNSDEDEDDWLELALKDH